jgi:hypothetical protein
VRRIVNLRPIADLPTGASSNQFVQRDRVHASGTSTSTVTGIALSSPCGSGMSQLYK